MDDLHCRPKLIHLMDLKLKGPSMHHCSGNNYSSQHKTNWKIIAGLWPYLTEFKGHVFLAVGMLVLAKVATVSTPLALKYIVDYLDQNRGADMLLRMPLVLVGAYGALRFRSEERRVGKEG